MTSKFLDLDFTKADCIGSLDFTQLGSVKYMRNDLGALQQVHANRHVIEGARLVTNYCGYSDPTVAQLTTAGNVTDSATPISGFRNSIDFGDNTLLRTAYSNADVTNLKEGRTYCMSFYVEMDDGAAPVVGTASNLGDFSIVVGGTVATVVNSVNVYDNVWRVWGVRAEDSAPNAACGAIKYTGQSARTFKATGFQLEDVCHKGPAYLPSEYTVSRSGTSFPGSKYYFDSVRTNFAIGNNNLDEVASSLHWNASSWQNLASVPTKVAEGTIPDIDGSGANWFYIQEDTDNVQHYFRWTTTYMGFLYSGNCMRSDVDICFSFYATAGERTDLMFQTITNGNHQRGFVDLTDGTTSSVSAAYESATVTDTGKVGPTGNPIYKIEVVWQDNDATFTPYFDIAVYDGAAVSGIYTGDGSSGIYFSAAQWEYSSYRTPTILCPNVDVAAEVPGAALVFGEPKGLRTHTARTNLIAESWDFNTTWAESGVETVITVQTDKTFDPMGGRQATIIGDDGLGGTASCGMQYAVTLATSTEYMYGFFAKAYGRSWVYGSVSGLGALDITQYYNLGTGALGTSGANVTRSGMIPFRDGWYFCWMVFTSDAVDTSGVCNIFVADNDNDSVVTRNGVSHIFAFGGQLQAGTTPWNWIYTDGATASPYAQSFERPLTAAEVEKLSDGTTGWTAVSRGERHERQQATTTRVWGVGSTSDEVFLSLRDDGPDNLTTQTRVGASLSGSSVCATLSASENTWRHAANIETNNLYTAGNSGTNGPDLTASIPDLTGWDLHIGQRDGAAQIMDGWTKNLSFFDSALEQSDINNFATGAVEAEEISFFNTGDETPFLRKRERDKFRRRYNRR